MDNTYGSNYIIKRRFFNFFGVTYRIFDMSGNFCFYIRQKAFKLREDIRVYTDELKTDEVFMIKAREIIDISATYDIFDSKTNVKLGALRRRGMKSIIKDEWIILNENDAEIGRIKEDNAGAAIFRRFVSALYPQTFFGYIGQTEVLTFKQKFNPFIHKIELDFSEDQANLLDRRLGLCAGILLSAIEGRQNN